MGHSYGCTSTGLVPIRRSSLPIPPSLSTTASQQTNQNPLRSFMLKVESGKENFSSTEHTTFALASLDKIITGFTALKMPR